LEPKVLKCFQAELTNRLIAGKADKMAEIGYTTKLAIQRTVMAADRTLMAWIRTALSMISFGFTIYKVIDGLQSKAAPIVGELDGRRFGLILCGLGIISITVGIIEFFMTIRDIRERYDAVRWRYSLMIAAIMLTLGLTMFLMIWARLA
jgi:putative membrane protein